MVLRGTMKVRTLFMMMIVIDISLSCTLLIANTRQLLAVNDLDLMR
jgi:hypothetical protein